MKSIYSIIILTSICTLTAQGQINNPWTQYNQVPYLQNAGLTGIEEYTDIRAGFKKQWASFRGAPENYFAGVNHRIAKNSEASATTPPSGESARSVRLGVAGYVAQSRYNAINDTQVGLAYAVHIPVSSQYYLALGLTANYNGVKADMNELVVRDPQDPLYMNLQSNRGKLNYFGVDAGLVLYSTNLYAGYSTQRLVRTRFNSDIEGNEKSAIRHTIILGYSYALTEAWDVQPAVLYRHEKSLDDIYNISLKARYNGMLWGGISLSPGESFSLLAGVTINRCLALNYSYDISTGKTSNVSQGNHEVILGIMPFNKVRRKAILW